MAIAIGVSAFVGKDDLTPLRDLIVKKAGNFL